ncbi:hypothetical protein XENTR_v10007099 [Xenopus tropicalis]|nr:hypothetical protein XENTR_v10007099 [Xenopus tropicalis]
MNTSPCLPQQETCEERPQECGDNSCPPELSEQEDPQPIEEDPTACIEAEEPAMRQESTNISPCHFQVSRK